VPDAYRVVTKGDGVPQLSPLNPFALRYSHVGNVISVSASDSPKGLSLSLSSALCSVFPEGILDLLTFRFLLVHREPEYYEALRRAVLVRYAGTPPPPPPRPSTSKQS
jgi:hypothetical protein